MKSEMAPGRTFNAVLRNALVILKTVKPPPVLRRMPGSKLQEKTWWQLWKGGRREGLGSDPSEGGT